MHIQVNNLKVSLYWNFLKFKIQIDPWIHTYIIKIDTMVQKVNHYSLYWPYDITYSMRWKKT
jgi:hypothetical protein